MRITYRGFLLAADHSMEKPGFTVAGIFSIPSYDSQYETTLEMSPTHAINELKKKVKELTCKS